MKKAERGKRDAISVFENPETPSFQEQLEPGVPATLGEVAQEFAPTEITIIKETLKVVLSDEDYKHFAILMGQANTEIGAAEDQLAAVKSQFKSRIDAAVAKRNEYAGIINAGCEYKSVECQLIKNYSDGTISNVRMDTGKQVGSRLMTSEERQRGLDFMKLQAAAPEEEAA